MPGRPPTQTAASRSSAVHHQLSRHEKEQHYQRLSLMGAAAIVVIVAILLGVGWYQSYVRPFHQTVVTVGSMRADMTFFIKELKQLLPQFSAADPTVVLNSAPDATASVIEQEFILLQRAGNEGVTVSDQEVDDAVAQQLGVVGVNGEAATRLSLESGLRDKLGSTGLTLAEYRQQVKALLLRDKVRDKLQADYPKTGPAAKYSEITLNKPDDAKTILNRLNNGESWDAIANEVRQNPKLGTATENDFQPKLAIDDNLVGPLFALSDGQHTGVIQSLDGRYTIGMMVQKDDQHPYTDDMLTAIGPRLFTNWIDDQKKTLPVKVNLNDESKLFAVQHSDFHPAPPTQPSQPQNPAPGQAPVAVPAQVPGINSLPPGIATPTGGLVAPTIPASAGTPAR